MITVAYLGQSRAGVFRVLRRTCWPSRPLMAKDSSRPYREDSGAGGFPARSCQTYFTGFGSCGDIEAHFDVGVNRESRYFHFAHGDLLSLNEAGSVQGYRVADFSTLWSKPGDLRNRLKDLAAEERPRWCGSAHKSGFSRRNLGGQVSIGKHRETRGRSIEL